MKRSITILYDGNKDEIELTDGLTPHDIIKKLGLHIDNTIIVKGNMPMPLDEELQEGDILNLVRVASGG